MVNYKLTYFQLRGTGEIARQIFVVAGERFEDNRIANEQWPALKPTTPFGQLPVLHVDGKPLAQSHAIARFLARQFGLNGKTAWEEAQVNSIADQFKDYTADVRPFFLVVTGFAQGDINKLRTDVFLPAFTRHFALFSKILKANPSGYFVGDSLTWVDLLIAQHVSDLLEAQPAAFDTLPEFKAHQQKVHSNANLKKWIETRPQSPF